MSVDPREIRRAFGSFMTGVTIVTAQSDDAVPVGFTANSFSSVSLDPPLLLVCPSKSLNSFPVFRRCENFAVSVLAEDQRAIANVFASDSSDRFARIGWQEDASGCPILNGAAATFSLRVHERVDAGDHMVLLGEVEAFEYAGKAGLGYSNDGYFSLGLERRATDVPRSSEVTVGAIVSFGDQVLLTKTEGQWHPPQVTTVERRGLLDAIRNHLDSAEVEVRFGPVYSVFDHQSNGRVSTYYRANAVTAPARAAGELIAVDKLKTLAYVDGAVKDMMCRFALEYRQGAFGLYVGDETEGDVHMMTEGEVR